MTDIFGVYNIRSRISVGLVVLAPLLIQAYMLIPEVRNISSTFVITIITFALSNLMIIVARTNGSKALHKCFPDSLPAQQYLLPEDNTIDKYTKARYYAFFKSRLNGFEITDNATDMKAHSESAIKWLISQTRNSTEFPLITEENTRNFARNTRKKSCSIRQQKMPLMIWVSRSCPKLGNCKLNMLSCWRKRKKPMPSTAAPVRKCGSCWQQRPMWIGS